MESRPLKNDETVKHDLAELLSKKGWTLFDLGRLELSERETQAVRQWEEVFGVAFNLDQTNKENAGIYRVDQGVSVGYRVDDEREFFESRLTSSSLPEPNFPTVLDYATTVCCLYSIFSKIARQCIEDVACSIGLDADAFLDLTDVDFAGVLPESPPTNGNAEFGTKELIPTLSSSLLRICKYQSAKCEELETSDASLSRENLKSNVWFGAHTDSSFLTISLCSTTPGLDIVDQETNLWVCPERRLVEPGQLSGSDVEVTPHASSASVFTAVHDIEHASAAPLINSKNFAIVFVGEFLQVLTKNRFRAAVHRVRNFSAEMPPENAIDAHRTRISCPFIIRGRNNTVIDLHNTERYSHPGGEEALAEDKVPNLDGSSMRLVHQLLDRKRQKCFRDNGSAEGSSWVLSAYPVPPLPQKD